MNTDAILALTDSTPDRRRLSMARDQLTAALNLRGPGVPAGRWGWAMDHGVWLLKLAERALATPQHPGTDTPAIPEGMVPWHGGDSAPADWDGGPIMMRDGTTSDDEDGDPDQEWSWDHGHFGGDIIAYTPKPPADTPVSARARFAIAVASIGRDVRLSDLTYAEIGTLLAAATQQAVQGEGA